MDLENPTVDLHDPLTRDRVRNRTAPYVNERIDRLTAANVEHVTRQGRDAVIARLADLDREWDVDRALMVNFALVGALTNELGRRYAFFRHFFRVQQSFLLLHALAGWCPPVVLFRRLGFRTTREIEVERRALRDALRVRDPS